MKKIKNLMIFMVCSIIVFTGSVAGYQGNSGVKTTSVVDPVNYHSTEHSESYFEQLLNQEENQLKNKEYQLTETIMLTQLADKVSLNVSSEQGNVCTIYDLVRINIKNTGTKEQQFTEQTFRYSIGEEADSVKVIALNKEESEKSGVDNIAVFPFVLAPNESKDVALAFTYDLQGKTLSSSASDAEKGKYQYRVHYYAGLKNDESAIKLPFSNSRQGCAKTIREKKLI